MGSTWTGGALRSEPRATPPMMLVFCILHAALGLIACDESGCDEPDPQGEAAEGQPCVSADECLAGLTCIGTDFEDGAHCSFPEELPGGVDPGCLEHPDLWPEHQAQGVQPAGTDDQGCQHLLFVSACNCEETTSTDTCIPVQPFYRRETWRSCQGCCWRLISFWQDESVCEELSD